MCKVRACALTKVIVKARVVALLFAFFCYYVYNVYVLYYTEAVRRHLEYIYTGVVQYVIACRMYQRIGRVLKYLSPVLWNNRGFVYVYVPTKCSTEATRVDNYHTPNTFFSCKVYSQPDVHYWWHSEVPVVKYVMCGRQRQLVNADFRFGTGEDLC